MLHVYLYIARAKIVSNMVIDGQIKAKAPHCGETINLHLIHMYNFERILLRSVHIYRSHR